MSRCQILPLEALLSCPHPQSQQHKFIQKYDEVLGGGAARICMKICIACSHVGQMLFAGNKYLLLKRITVQMTLVSLIKLKIETTSP
jgi:hypothetical protein